MAGALTISTLNNDTGSLATQNGMTGICKSWVNFDGLNSPYSIRGSFNVSSVVRNGTGDYTVNFANAMPNGNYVTTINLSNNQNQTWCEAFTTTSYKPQIFTGSSRVDDSQVQCAVFSS
jgi:hypothetical protein